MRFGHLFTAVEAVNGARSRGKNRNVAEEGSGDDVTFYVQGGDCRHQAFFPAGMT